jgi:hypothetical protein
VSAGGQGMIWLHSEVSINMLPAPWNWQDTAEESCAQNTPRWLSFYPSTVFSQPTNFVGHVRPPLGL